MALIIADRVKDTSTTTGTGAFTLAATPPSGYRTFSAVCSTSDTVYYCIAHQSANEWEVGLGTYSSANTLTRTTVISSTNSNAAVNFSAGTKDVMLTGPAARMCVLNASSVLALANAPTVGGNVVWHAGNDGTGSGCDADTVDGYHASSFAQTNTRGDFSQLWINSTDPYFHWNESDGGTNAKYWRMYVAGGVWTFDLVNDAYTATTAIMSVSRSGTTPSVVTFSVGVVAASYDTSSDERLKENIRDDIPDGFMDLKPVSFNFKTNPDRRMFGFIAQDVQKIFPELVSANEQDGFLRVDYQGIFTAAVKRIQEQERRIAKLEDVIASLIKDIDELKRR